MSTIALIIAPVAALLTGLAIGMWIARQSSRRGEELESRFKVLAQEILDTSTKRVTEQNQSNLGMLLDPLRSRLTEFQDRIERIASEESEKRVELRTQIHQLTALNTTLSADAKSLAEALRGSNKTQGNWGEQILERMLESAGLLPEVHFVTQDAQHNADGKRVQPDVVILLPEERRIVVDSKVSLIDYQAACDAATDDERTAAVRRHIQSIRAHIKGLSDKRYETAYAASLDFVVLFVPIEPAFLMAVTEDATLAEDAWRQNILLVSPSTLLFVLRTVAYLWRQETQVRKTGEIVERARTLYDKLNGFVVDLERVGTALGAAQDAYDSAFNKLSKGRGNVLRQAQLLESLGIPKPKRPAASFSRVAQEDDLELADLLEEEERDAVTDGASELIAPAPARPQLGGAAS